MTIAIPGLRRTAPKHRAIDRVAHLEHQLTGAGEFIKRLQKQLAEADAHIERQTAELRQTAGQLGVAVVEGMERADRIAELEETQAELTELRARVANLDPYHVLQVGGRDIDPGDQATEPIDVRALRAAHGDDYYDQTREEWRVPVTVRPLWQAPFATGPQTVTIPEPMDDRTIADRFKAGEHVVTVTGGPYRKATVTA